MGCSEIITRLSALNYARHGCWSASVEKKHPPKILSTLCMGCYEVVNSGLCPDQDQRDNLVLKKPCFSSKVGMS